MKTINETFICLNCEKEVSKADKTCRNHCPYCFTSLHVDGEVPGDRTTTCHGQMFPRSYETKNGTIRILFVCSACGKEHWNKRASDDEISSLPQLIEQYRGNFL